MQTTRARAARDAAPPPQSQPGPTPPPSPALTALLAQSAGDPHRLYLKLRGDVQLIWAGRALPAPGPKPLALLAYLHLNGLSAPNGQTGRDELAQVFWPTKRAALQNVRQALSALRRLGDAQGEWLRDGAGGLSVAAVSDVSELRRLVGANDGAGALVFAQDSGELLGQRARVSATFDNWLQEESASVRTLSLRTLRARGLELLEDGDYDAARVLLTATLDQEGAGDSEATFRALMTLEHQAGRAAQALEVFGRCRRALQDELDAAPAPETLELLRRIEGQDTGGNQRGRVLEAGAASPGDTEPLFGREGVRQRLVNRLECGERALLHGLGGIGKTRVAEAVARHFTGSGGRVLWLEVGGDPAHTVLSALADLSRARTGTPLAAALERENIALIVLDNASNTYALHQILEQLPAGARVLVTSRLRLPGLKWEELTRLDRESALCVLKHHLEATEPTAQNAAAFNQEALCALLGDHPFALRLAARTLGSSGGGEVIQALHIQELYDAPHDTVRVLLEQSLSGVSAREYEVFLALGSLYVPQATPELLSLLLGRPLDDTETALGGLVDRGLLTREARAGSDTLSFRMHDLTWHAARERRAHLPHHLTRAVTEYAEAFTDKPDLLATDLPHLLGAASAAPPELLRRLMRGWLGGPYIGARGFPTAHLHLLRQAAASAEAAGDWDTASILNGKAADISQALLGDQAGAIQLLLRAAGQAGQAGAVGRQAVQLALAGQLGAANGLPEAARWLQTARELADGCGDPIVQARVRSQRAVVHAFGKEFPQARALLGEACAMLREHLEGAAGNDRAVWAVYLGTLGNLGQSEMRLGNLEEALRLKREMGRIAAERDERLYMARAALDQGELLHQLGQSEDAMVQLRQAIEISQGVGSGSLESLARGMLQNIASAG